ncbi:MAG TPA: tetratricopeptide repeat protein [Comamonas sp.]|uniref:tetratricopeptide repeat protein n=1 Tax=Comamonas halotolerans TaxID=3041496 RepID=UPI0024E1297B|nr:tetratricopeptide repeat protein [Comamonas sp. NoAH]
MHFKNLGWISFAALVIAGCAQTPADQLSRSETVRVCTGNSCVDQHRDTVTFKEAASDPEAERRLQALEQLGEKNPKAAYDLALRFLRGDGVDRDSHQGIEWMRKAGDQGLVDAQFALGRLYLMGFEEMGSDPAEAEAWLTRAAAKGHKEAARLLPQAQAAKKDEHAAYQVREADRKSWGYWYTSAPYYWHWRGSSWYLH